MCDMNKNHLLTLFFHEGTPREEKEIQKHVDQCGECRDYLLTLDHTHNILHEWKDEAPLPNTLDMILADIPEPRVKPSHAEPAPAEPGRAQKTGGGSTKKITFTGRKPR